MNTSFSALDTFRTCPLKYKYQQIDKIKTPKSPEAIFGSLMHDTMKFIHTGQFIMPTQKEALHHFSTNWEPDVFEDEVKERAAFAQGVNIVQKYYKKNDPNKFQIVDLESRFTIEIENKNKKETHLVSGFIDRIDKIEDGFEIIDYKTSRKLPPQKMIDSNLQLLIYLLAFLKRYPNEEKNLGKVKLSLYFLQHGTKLSAQKNPDQLQAGIKEVLDIIDQIENLDYPPMVTPLCDWCGYQKMCPMWKHKFKDERKSDAEKEKIIDEYVALAEDIKTNRKKLGELQREMLEIMEIEEVERLFGKDKIVSKTHRQTFTYDEKKLKQILLDLGKWDDVVKVDGVKLRKIMETLPIDKKKEIEDTKELKSESFSLSVKKQ